MARSNNEDIISLCDRITDFCIRLNKRLDAAYPWQQERASFYQLDPSYALPAYATPWQTTAEPYFDYQPPPLYQPDPEPASSYGRPPLINAGIATYEPATAVCYPMPHNQPSYMDHYQQPSTNLEWSLPALPQPTYTPSQHLSVELQPLDQPLSRQPSCWEPPVNSAPHGYPSNNQPLTPQQPSPARPFVLPPYTSLESPLYAASETDGPLHSTPPELQPGQTEYRSSAYALSTTSSGDVLECNQKENLTLDCDRVEEDFADLNEKIQDSSVSFGGVEKVDKAEKYSQDYERKEKQVQSREMIECSLQLNASRLQTLRTQIDLCYSMEDNASLELLSDSSDIRGVASMNHLSTSLDADARLIPPRHDTPSPKLRASPSWFDMSVVEVFVQPNYLHNFFQSTFNGIGVDKFKGATIVVHEPFILTANSNPGGPNEDFSIKRSMENSGKYVSVHLWFEEDMVSFYGCVYDGGEQEKLHMNVVNKRDWKGRIIASFELGDVILFGSGQSMKFDEQQEFHDVFLDSQISESGCLFAYWFSP